MHSFAPEFLERLRFERADLVTVQALGAYRGKQDLFRKQTPETLEALRKVARVESTESSNRIEGIEAPRVQLEKIVLHHAAPRNRSEQEIAGYRDALALIHDSAPAMPLSPNLILQLHQTVFRYLPGEGGQWKTTDNEIIDLHADGSHRVRFRTVPALATPQAMEDLVGAWQHAHSTHAPDALVLVPLLVFDFLCIHPFRDGNGRVARLLTLLALYQAGYEVGRYISLERVIEESKATYYETLEASSQRWHEGTHDPFPWLRYFWGTLLRAYKEFEDRLGHIAPGRGSKTKQVREAALRQIAPFAISDLERLCPGVGRDMVRLVLRQLRDEGLLNSSGVGRAAKWQRAPTTK
ncbi:MAG: Fic family protein [Verrucomicrobia bacterium]|nr:Fic family protein [Verrucomicrobiota bacterium]